MGVTMQVAIPTVDNIRYKAMAVPTSVEVSAMSAMHSIQYEVVAILPTHVAVPAEPRVVETHTGTQQNLL